MDPIIIPDEETYPSDTADRVYPPEYEGHFSRLLIKREEILSRTASLAELLHNDYRGKRPVILCVLKGSTPFYINLLEALQDLTQGYYMEYIRVKSYDGLETTGRIKVEGAVPNLEGKDVIIVEDILDTGTTLSHLIPILEEQSKASSIEVCTLLTKRISEPQKVKAKYVGFSIPSKFVIGYGLDYNELYRDIRDVWIISQKGIDCDPKSLP